MSGTPIMNIISTQSIAMGDRGNLTIIKDITLKLLAYCRANKWAGYDPYDALNGPERKGQLPPLWDGRTAERTLRHMLAASSE